MSVEALAIALHHSRAETLTGRLLIIGIANHHGDGGAWPSIDTLRKYAGTRGERADRRNVQKELAKLESLGEISRVVNGGGTRETPEHMRPNLYRFLLQCPPDCDRSTQHRTRNDAPRVPLFGADTDPVAHTPRGAADAPAVAPTPRPPAAPAPHEPSLEPSLQENCETQVIAREGSSLWSSERCPANWRSGIHELGAHDKCSWCHERAKGVAA